MGISPSADRAYREVPSGLCPSCGAARPGAFCPACGERRLDPAHDHSLRWLVGEVLSGLAQFDGRLLRTFRTLLLHPGQLTRDQLEGRRVRTLPPLQVFFVTSVVFYLFFERAYAAPIASLAQAYTAGDWIGNVFRFDIATALQVKADASGQTVDALKLRVFDRAGQESKIFLGVLVPFFAGALNLLFRRRSPRYVPHFVAAVHLFSVFLCFDLVLLTVYRLLGYQGVTDVMFVPLVVAYFAYLWSALRRIYRLGWFAAVAAALAVLASLLGLVLIYRQVMTIVAVWLT